VKPLVRLALALLALGPAALPRPLAAGAPGPPRTGDPDRGAILYRQCAVCHALAPGQHLTGPSLAHIWGRTAGTVPGFGRYSEALRRSGLTWSQATLDRFLADPQKVVPGTVMVFAGLDEEAARADLIAYLREVGTGQRPPAPPPDVVSGPKLDLGRMGPEQRVVSIRHCGDAYFVRTEAGETFPYWDYNLRFKTDSTPRGPARGRPVLVPSGSIGDRAYVVFASPEEISARIERRCGP
jgi:cytochrome c